MLARANEIKTKHNKTNVTFLDSQITSMPAIPSDSVDCIISNCVVNLVPEADKPLVFNEMYRILKPGGRVALSDILAKKPLPEKLRANMALYVGCVSGASLVAQYEKYLKEAGFSAESLLIKDDGADLNVYIETNPDGSRTVGGTGGNLCCNPRIESAPAPASSSCCAPKQAPAAASSCCSGDKPESAASSGAGVAATAATAPSSCSAKKTEPDAAVAAAAASSAPCCGGETPADQTYAFDEKDLADLEGEDLNSWAGKFLFVPSEWFGIDTWSRIIQDLCCKGCIVLR